MTASKITHTLYMGDWQDVARMRDFNIVTVAKDSPVVGALYFPLVDGPDENNEHQLHSAIFMVDSLLACNSYIFVHCV